MPNASLRRQIPGWWFHASKRKEMDQLEFEHSPHVTRFRTWKRSFRRAAITGSTDTRQATGWLAEIDEAKSLQDVDDVGSVGGSTRMRVETLDSEIGKDLMNPESSVSRRIAKKKLLMLTIDEFFKINDFQRRAEARTTCSRSSWSTETRNQKRIFANAFYHRWLE